jgi:hypothetical protein
MTPRGVPPEWSVSSICDPRPNRKTASEADAAF